MVRLLHRHDPVSKVRFSTAFLLVTIVEKASPRRLFPLLTTAHIRFAEPENTRRAHTFGHINTRSLARAYTHTLHVATENTDGKDEHARERDGTIDGATEQNGQENVRRANEPRTDAVSVRENDPLPRTRPRVGEQAKRSLTAEGRSTDGCLHFTSLAKQA